MSPEQLGMLSQYVSTLAPDAIRVPDDPADVQSACPALDVRRGGAPVLEFYRAGVLVERVRWPL